MGKLWITRNEVILAHTTLRRVQFLAAPAAAEAPGAVPAVPSCRRPIPISYEGETVH